MALMIGIQGSGKSEFCRHRLSDGYVRINLDTLKTRNRERLLFLSCLENRENFVVDNTNPTKADRERYIPAAKEHGYRIVGYYMKPHLQESMERNRRREGKARIPDCAIPATLRKLEPPEPSEGFDALYLVDNDGVTMTVTEWTGES